MTCDLLKYPHSIHALFFVIWMVRAVNGHLVYLAAFEGHGQES